MFRSRLQAPIKSGEQVADPIAYQNVGTFLPQGGFQTVNASITAQERCKVVDKRDYLYKYVAKPAPVEEQEHFKAEKIVYDPTLAT